MKKTPLFLLSTVFVAAACGRAAGPSRHDQQYDVVQEGSASGVTSTINSPGEVTPPMTGTNADTTTAFNLPTATATTTGAPGTIAGTLTAGDQRGGYPVGGTSPMVSSSPRTPTPVTKTPAQSTNTAAPSPVRPAQPVPRPIPPPPTTTTAEPQPEQQPNTDTVEPSTDTTTTTRSDTAPPPKEQKPKPKKNPDQPPPEEPPPPPPTATETNPSGEGL